MLKQRCYRLYAVLLLIFVAQVVNGADGLIQVGSEPNYSALSGVWEGTLTLIQKGRCHITGSGRSTQPTVLTIEVASDGSFKATSKEIKTFTWSGKIDKDMTVTATLTGKGNCRGQLQDFKSDYSGKITEKKGIYHLQIEGIDEPCPAQGCGFKAIYRVKQK